MKTLAGLVSIASVLAAASASAQTAPGPRQPGQNWEPVGRSGWSRAPLPSYGTEAGREVGREISDRAVPLSDTGAPIFETGALVTGRDGVALGHIVGVAEGDDSGQWYAVVRSEREGLRAIVAEALSLDPSGTLLSDITAYQFRRLPELPETDR